ncbi:PREDICTED: cytochrome c oxidase assembly protein COX11, mitochondrial-like, partial [Rhagoletis zephyria]|uniref:cytochrome c oxidase assembly protein COX11, mitochondrial-like n=1 Tax=Rhagoletis zephyria TaxID=28612 RepID=UPI000811874E
MLRFLHKSRVHWMRLSRFRYHSTSGRGGADAGESARKQRLKSTLYYLTAGGIFAAGASYAAVPLYRMFCQAYSYGGTTTQGH